MSPEGLSTRVKENLERAGLSSSHSILTTSETDLRRLANLSLEEVDKVKCEAACSYVSNKFMTVFEAKQVLAKKWQFLSTGSKVIDDFLGGGLAMRGITEIAGESGSGKTQMCLQASLCVQYPESCGGLDAGAVYICTEDVFPSSRFQQLLQSFTPEGYPYKLEPSSKLGDSIFIEHVHDAESLKQCVLVRLPNLLLQKKIGLIVVDSIAGAFRSDYDIKQGAVLRAQDLRSIGCQLHRLADEFNLAVVCVNQVTTVPRNQDGESVTVPALGLAWANLVTTRLQLFRTNFFSTVPDYGDVIERQLKVVFSPYLPNSSCRFVVTGSRVKGLPPNN